MKPRVNALLKQAGGDALDQTVRPRIEGDDVMVVTEIEPTVAATAGAPPPGMEPRPAAISRSSTCSMEHPEMREKYSISTAVKALICRSGAADRMARNISS